MRKSVLSCLALGAVSTYAQVVGTPPVQCGGIGYTGVPGNCPKGYACLVRDESFSGCYDISHTTSDFFTATTTPAATPKPSQTLWGQCGGQQYTGPTYCGTKGSCTTYNEWYAQCIPATTTTTFTPTSSGPTTGGGPTITPIPSITPTPTGCPWLCVDNINECGQMYGGCTTHCPGAPWPTFSKPPCPSTTSTTPITPTPTSVTTTPTATPTCPVECFEWPGQCPGDQPIRLCQPHCPGDAPPQQPPPPPSIPWCHLTSYTQITPTFTTSTMLTTPTPTATPTCPIECFEWPGQCPGDPPRKSCHRYCPGDPYPTPPPLPPSIPWCSMSSTQSPTAPTATASPVHN
ncbi:hypothetical protein BJ508DRAFT_413800 [Ascobolus immersus RN42]|uniref:CBM1 domain-containing protein n=1 Tax=Ascobolus immersus RN42 TaxID=1160509 RepID=A0A3N4I9X4_ASCIM|nr:hypothetical protein BJ508DRAFT_413800 [Ascobolus immersus RN42]